MTKPTRSEVQRLLTLAQPSLAAQNAGQFMSGLKHGFDTLHSALMAKGSRAYSLELLDAALSGSFGSNRQKQVVEICAWPIFDKPALPGGPDGLPEFLWLYCLPIVVQFSEKDTRTPIRFKGPMFDNKAAVTAAYQSGWFNPKSVLSELSPLLTREDLQREGPISLSTRFVKAELGLGLEDMQPHGVLLDAEVECARVVTFYAVGAARLPVGESSLFTSQQLWDSGAVERIVLAGLTEQGYNIESVTSLPPCSMAESLLRCTSIGHLEMHKVLTLASRHYDLESIILEHPADGWAELHATLKGDPEAILVLPSFSFVEPQNELQASVRRCCEDLGLRFTGSFSVAGPTSSMMQ